MGYCACHQMDSHACAAPLWQVILFCMGQGKGETGNEENGRKGYYSQQFFRLINQQNVEQVNLSNRELEVLEHIAEGHSTNTIARELNISNNTVEFHRHNLMSKLQASNVANMVKKAMLMGLAFIKH